MEIMEVEAKMEKLAIEEQMETDTETEGQITRAAKDQVKASIKRNKIVDPTYRRHRYKMSKQKEAVEGQKKSSKNVVYHKYMYKLLQEIHPGLGISLKAIEVMNGLTNNVCEKLVQEAARLARDKKTTITSVEIQAAVQLIFPAELVRHALHEGTKAVVKYRTY